MSDEPSKKGQALLFGVEQRAALLEDAHRDKIIAISHLHDHTSSTARQGDPMLLELCEYVMLLYGWCELLEGMGEYPSVPNSEGEKEYIVTEQDATLLEFFSTTLHQYTLRIEDRGLSLVVN